MALKKPSFEAEPTSTAADAGAPEGADTAVLERETAAPAAAAAPAAEQASTAIAVARSTAVSADRNEIAAKAKAFKAEVSAMRGAADFSYGAHRVFKAKDGAIKEMSGEKLKLGRWVQVQLLAWDRHFEISPGGDDKKSSAYVGYSSDGEVIDYVIGEEQREWIGKPVSEYLTYLIEQEDFPKAAKREFIDTQVAVLNSENEPDFHDIVQVSLSSSSIPAFRAYQSSLEAKARFAMTGIKPPPGLEMPENPFTFYYVTEDASKGSMSWTKLKIVSTLPAKF
ncbi:hypothetical protein H4CHR_02901 [Variovorax sp. PBS-H4]|uniref:hypothetical protein n=1 Tax=Variovorax sp. PBS-H4 TaxID=434008 RepID=UPI001319517C|nr:hypothetical protein [Variovorax sp. PBS-H4]VTU31898.1 hypothetical protein H4CHR_02901 [Variovorax sp. PBS-H4]